MTGKYDSTYCNWLAWSRLFTDHGIKHIDLEGVNSPKRGWFKLSFGGTLENYYSIEYEKS